MVGILRSGKEELRLLVAMDAQSSYPLIVPSVDAAKNEGVKIVDPKSRTEV